MDKTLIRKTMQNGAKETDRQENAAKRVISAIKRRKEKARRSEKSHFFGLRRLCECTGVLTRNPTR
jgi:hypothetical protein